MQLILASSSPRRQELLRQIGIPFVVEAPDVDEHAVEARSPAELVEQLALRKARAVAAQHPADIVLGADTVVVVDGEVLGKPAGSDKANKKTTFVDLLGVDECEALVRRKTEEAKAAVRGEFADTEFLERLADYLAERKR